MSGPEAKVVLVVCPDRTIQDAVRRVVEACGCRAVVTAAVEAAVAEVDGARPVVALVDPRLGGACAVLQARCTVAEIPLRVSSTGVRRMAKRNESAVRWLTALMASRCGP